jgi:mycoredoxin
MLSVRDLTMYTTVRCGYCRRLKAQLVRAGIRFRKVDIEHDAAAAAFVAGVNGGDQTVPIVLLPTGWFGADQPHHRPDHRGRCRLADFDPWCGM